MYKIVAIETAEGWELLWSTTMFIPDNYDYYEIYEDEKEKYKDDENIFVYCTECKDNVDIKVNIDNEWYTWDDIERIEEKIEREYLDDIINEAMAEKEDEDSDEEE